MAKQANGAVVVRSGDSVVLVTACMADQPKPGAGFFPAHRRLSRVHLLRRQDSGRIHQARRTSLRKGNSHQPPDRPPDPAAVPRRLPATKPRSSPWCSRPIPSRIPTRSPSSGAAAALAISEIPFHHVLGGVRVGMKDGKYIANPTYTEGRESKLNIVVAGTEEGIVMVEAGAQRGLRSGSARRHRVRPRVLQEDRRRHPRTGRSWPARRSASSLRPQLDQAIYDQIAKACPRGSDRRDEYGEVREAGKLRADRRRSRSGSSRRCPKSSATKAAKCFDALKERIFRDEMLKNHRRPDGRAFDEVRKITIETGVLPRTHGSALFTRGETQALVTVTLGTKDDEQRIELLEPGEATKRFMLHYNFPPFSVGEVGFMRGPGRREIGHGALAERVAHRADSRRRQVPLHHARGQRHPGIQRFELAWPRSAAPRWR